MMIRLGKVGFHQSFVSSVNYFGHRSKIIWPSRFYIKVAVVFLGFPSLNTTQAATGLVPEYSSYQNTQCA
jgi:hypothetical protein